MMGLAESAAMEQQEPKAQEQQEALAQQSNGNTPSVDEIVQLLIKGVPPEKLEEAGVPRELIMQAINIIEQQLGSQPPQNPSALEGQPQQVSEAGLAEQMASGVR